MLSWIFKHWPWGWDFICACLKFFCLISSQTLMSMPRFSFLGNLEVLKIFSFKPWPVGWDSIGACLMIFMSHWLWDTSDWWAACSCFLQGPRLVWHSQCVAGHRYYQLSVFLSFSLFYVFCCWPTSGKLPRLKICFPQYFGITRRYIQKTTTTPQPKPSITFCLSF